MYCFAQVQRKNMNEVDCLFLMKLFLFCRSKKVCCLLMRKSNKKTTTENSSTNLNTTSTSRFSNKEHSFQTCHQPIENNNISYDLSAAFYSSLTSKG